MNLIFRPLEKWPREEEKWRKRSAFKTPYRVEDFQRLQAAKELIEKARGT